MIDLYMALYTEGRTDDRFLPILIERTVERIVSQSKAEIVSVRHVYVVPRDEVATLAGGYDGADGAKKMMAIVTPFVKTIFCPI